MSQTPQFFQTPWFLNGIWLKFWNLETLIWAESGDRYQIWWLLRQSGEFKIGVILQKRGQVCKAWVEMWWDEKAWVFDISRINIIALPRWHNQVTERQLFENTGPSKTLDVFLSFLGQSQVPQYTLDEIACHARLISNLLLKALKGFQGFAGGPDTVTGQTGSHTIVTSYMGAKVPI